MYRVDGSFVYRQCKRKTDNRHTKQVARAHKRFHPRLSICDNWKFLQDEIHRGLRGFFFQKIGEGRSR